MKLASAMKYGGELVSAEDSDYNSFKELVPLCPNCKEPVFLRIGGDRLSVKGKEYKVGPHWCHFQGISKEQVAGCELRVNGYTEKDRAKIAAQARGQRLELLQRWFWKVLMSAHKESFEGSIESAIEKAKNFEPVAKGWIHKFIDCERERGSESNKDWKNRIELVISSVQSKHLLVFDNKDFALRDKWEDRLSSDFTEIMDSRFPVLIEFQKEYSLGNIPFEAELKSKQHAQLIREVCFFLWSKQNLSLLTSIFMLGFWEVIDYADQNPGFNPPGFTVWREGDKLLMKPPLSVDSIKLKTRFVSNESKLQAIDDWSWIYQICELHVLYLVATIPWASEFQRLEVEAKQQRNAA
jgi:hypothetical protein